MAKITPLPELRISAPRPLVLRLPKKSDCSAILDYHLRNREHFSSTSATPPPGFFTRSFWRPRFEIFEREFRQDVSVRFYIFDPKGATGFKKSRVIGSVNFTQINRGPLQACYMGYGLDEAEQGNGIMTAATRVAIEYMFREKNLHRIMANHLPENKRSAQVLERLGFQVEGRAKDYLFINGQWRDHVLNSLTNPDWRPT